MILEINEKTVEYASLGGALLGGGGGGSVEEGRLIGKMSVNKGKPTIVDINDLPHNATILTVSTVGAPAAKRKFTKPMDYVKAIEILKRDGVEVDGIVTCENGGFATLNGWFQSAVLKIPVVDAPCNGRAHPMGIMGSMGLHKVEEYISKQAAVGGNPDEGRYLEVYVSGKLDNASRIVRQTAVLSGGMVAVARNPVKVAYVRENAAVGALTQAIELGKIMSMAASMDDQIEGILKYLNGKIIIEGTIEDVELETTGGFDVGNVYIKTEVEEYVLTFWNEYICLEREGQRIATFPDLIATVSLETGFPLTTAEIKKRQNVAILSVPKENLKLGSGMKDPELFKEVEKITGKKIVTYLAK
ncbi:MAG: DUF917 domain-containing protein [bacterium]